MADSLDSDIIIFDEIQDDNEYLEHYGMPRRSGRYPWGSGEDPYQHTRDLLSRVTELKKQGFKETPEEIAKEFGLSTTEYRAQKGLATDLRRMDLVARAESLKEDGLNNTQIGKEMGVPESTVRNWFDADRKVRMYQAKNAADFMREQINKKGPCMIGSGVENELNISRQKMDQAIAILQAEGYEVRGGRVPQVTNPAQMTTIKLLCPPGTPKNAAYKLDEINSLNEYISHDNGETFTKFVYPKSMDSKRLMIRYKEDGGEERDGLIELRRGVNDLSLGDSHYSQVRILVDDHKYLKGMAVYSAESDSWPAGVDVVFNSNKPRAKGLEGALKDIKKDPDNPFGSAIKQKGGQSYYTDENGKKQLSLINKRADEGDWSDWKDAVPAQFLSKQPVSLAKKQLKIAIDDKTSEFNSIMELNNPTVKKYFLNKFAEECDSAAVHLKAASLPGQKYKVMLPINTLKETEVYAPGYENGTKLALVRYPHGGIFEIPILTVNNKNKLGNAMVNKQSLDAVGVNKAVADRLSGADFDGDTVMCIPTSDGPGKVHIKNKKPLDGLKGFDTKMAYGADSDPVVDKDGKKHYYRNGREYQIMNNTQTEMGKISNLITDMTLKGANEKDLAAAVRHSMVVIDAEKHKLDYKQSEMDNDIARLKREYQKQVDSDGKVHYGGASTLISRAKGETSVVKRQGQPNINMKGKPWYDPTKPEGALVYKTAYKMVDGVTVDDTSYTVAKVNRRNSEAPNATIRTNAKGNQYIQFDGEDEWVKLNNSGKEVDGTRVSAERVTKVRTQPSTKMAETPDARTLISDMDTQMEHVYADYANTMKKMANEARKTLMYTGNLQKNAGASKVYAEEIKSLESKLKTAKLNSPRERMAHVKANLEVNIKKKANPEMTNDEIKKAGQQALEKYRNELGSVNRRERSINISEKEWAAIQAGAISENKLVQILNNSDADVLRSLATPRNSKAVSQAKINRIRRMADSGRSIAEIATQLGISSSTVSKYIKE